MDEFEGQPDAGHRGRFCEPQAAIYGLSGRHGKKSSAVLGSAFCQTKATGQGESQSFLLCSTVNLVIEGYSIGSSRHTVDLGWLVALRRDESIPQVHAFRWRGKTVIRQKLHE